MNDQGVVSRRDTRDLNLVDMHREAAGREGLPAQCFQDIDLRRSRDGVRCDLHGEIQGIAGGLIVDAIDPDVVEYQLVLAAADFSGYGDVGREIRTDAIVAEALTEPGHHMRLQHQPVGCEADMRGFKVGEANSLIVAQVPSSLAVEQLLHDQGLHAART